MYMLSRLLLLAAFITGGVCFVGLAVKFAPWSWIAIMLWVMGRVIRRGGRRYLWGHGVAEWCSVGRMKAAGMFTGQGLILGRAGALRPGLLRSAFGLLNPFRRNKTACRNFLAAVRFMKPDSPLVRMPPKNVHSVVFAPVGAGKSTGIVIPWLLTNPDSCVVIDFKGELAQATAKARRRMGHKVVILDPFKIVTNDPDRLNPLDFIEPDSPEAIDDCCTIAEALVVRQGTEAEPHWNDSAEIWIGAMIALTVCEAVPHERNLQSTRAVLADPGRIKEALDVGCASKRWRGLLARWFAQLRHPAEKERGSILSTSNRAMSFLDSLAVAESVCGSTFDPADLRKGKMTVYLVIPPDRIRTQTGLLRMWINMLMRACVKQGLGEKKLVHFMLDEAAALGKMDSLTELVDKYRGYGLRAVFVYQSQGQLVRCWPEDQGMTLLSNGSAIYFGVNDPGTAEQVSKRLGNQTIEIDSYGNSSGDSRSRPAGSFASNQGTDGTSTGDSYNVNQIARALLKPEEVMGLDPRIAITFIPGMSPVATRLVRYYEESLMPGLIRRTLGAVKVLIAAALVLALAVLLIAALASVERPAPEPQRTTPKSTTGIFGE